MTVPHPESHNVRGHILLIEDTSVLREIESLVLRQAGYLVVGCSEPERALAQINVRPFDIAIINSDLPGAVTGEFVAALRRDRPELAIIALVPNPTPEFAGVLKSHGASIVLDRPVTPRLLLQQIDGILRLKNHDVASPGTERLMTQDHHPKPDFAGVENRPTLPVWSSNVAAHAHRSSADSFARRSPGPTVPASTLAS